MSANAVRVVLADQLSRQDRVLWLRTTPDGIPTAGAFGHPALYHATAGWLPDRPAVIAKMAPAARPRGGATEGAIHARVHEHPNVLSLLAWAAPPPGLDTGAIGAREILVMPVAGASVYDLMHAPLPDIHPLAMVVLSDGLHALAHLASLGVCHRDLHDKNILLTADDGGPPRAVVMDFGRSLGPTELHTGPVAYFAVQTHPSVVPPEAIGITEVPVPPVSKRVCMVDPRSDVWSLAVVVLMTKLRGVRPFASDTGRSDDSNIQLVGEQLAHHLTTNSHYAIVANACGGSSGLLARTLSVMLVLLQNRPAAGDLCALLAEQLDPETLASHRAALAPHLAVQ
jgi:serine/threonine protein kinase